MGCLHRQYDRHDSRQAADGHLDGELGRVAGYPADLCERKFSQRAALESRWKVSVLHLRSRRQGERLAGVGAGSARRRGASAHGCEESPVVLCVVAGWQELAAWNL